MLIKKLELFGFKTFAERTQIELSDGITAIVGPNGCGKSNVADALLWVLGESNVRNLRGQRATDVIFSGSDQRRALGMAEVSLTLDNACGTLPLDFNEVTVTRRAYKSGDAEYYINKARCRLKDIYELFRKAAPTWQGIPLGRLKKDPTGVTWPCPQADQPDARGTLYPGNRFLTKDGKVELRSPALGAIKWEEPEGSPKKDEKSSGDYPLIFTQGKVVWHWQHTYTNWSSFMSQFSKGNYVQVHPETVRNLGLRDGDWVHLETEIGKIKAKLCVSNSILPGVVWTPSHPAPISPFPGNAGESINTIIPNYWDKVSAQFNGFGCRLTRA